MLTGALRSLAVIFITSNYIGNSEMMEVRSPSFAKHKLYTVLRNAVPLCACTGAELP